MRIRASSQVSFHGRLLYSSRRSDFSSTCLGLQATCADSSQAAQKLHDHLSKCLPATGPGRHWAAPRGSRDIWLQILQDISLGIKTSQEHRTIHAKCCSRGCVSLRALEPWNTVLPDFRTFLCVVATLQRSSCRVNFPWASFAIWGVLETTLVGLAVGCPKNFMKNFWLKTLHDRSIEAAHAIILS